MGKKKKKPRRRPAAAPTVRSEAPPKTPEPAARTGASRLVIAGIGSVVAMAIAVVLFVGEESESRATTFPPPAAAAPDPGPALADFVGAEACADCHQAQYAAWASSTHGRAGGVPSREILLTRFDGTPIRFRDAVVTPRVDGNGDFVFTVTRTGMPNESFVVAGVVGGGHMVGGGTQGFLSSFPDGTLRFLPFDFIRREDVWFCNTNTRTDQGWVPITPDMALADCGDWPPIRVFGAEDRFANCQECHGSQVSVRFDAAAGRYDTQIRSLRINCESCHGPAREHVERARTGRLSGIDLGVRALGHLGEDASLDVCFQCHALKERVRPEYLPGTTLQDYYALLMPLVGDRPFFADGRVRTFAYQLNHRASSCYLDGTMTCVDCHEPHGQGYRDVNGLPLSDRFADGQCTSCHASKATEPTRHTNHAPDSPGSRCVACHMPYLQHPELGNQLRFARSDHTIPIPRPAFDAALGVESACLTCHENLGVERLETAVRDWYGTVKPHKDIVTALLAAERNEGGIRPRDLVRPDLDHPMAQMAALNRLMADVPPDAGWDDPEVVTRLQALADHRDVDLRAMVLATLHYGAGTDGDMRRWLSDRLRALGENDRPIRDRWVLALGQFADRWRDRGSPATALIAYRKALEIHPGHAGVLRNMGLAYNEMRDFTNAVAQFERSFATDSSQPLTLVNLGLALEGLGRDDEAAARYRQALSINPTEALASFNLGNYHLRREEPAQAIASYRAALTYDPGLALAHYYLARSLILTDALPEALVSVRRALEFDETIAGAHDMRRELERVLGGG